MSVTRASTYSRPTGLTISPWRYHSSPQPAGWHCCPTLPAISSPRRSPAGRLLERHPRSIWSWATTRPTRLPFLSSFSQVKDRRTGRARSEAVRRIGGILGCRRVQRALKVCLPSTRPILGAAVEDRLGATLAVSRRLGHWQLRAESGHPRARGSDMGRKNPLVCSASCRPCLIAAQSVAIIETRSIQVSTVRSAVIDGMKKYAAAVSSTNCFGISRVVRRFPVG